jgi:hypothetical protein
MDPLQRTAPLPAYGCYRESILAITYHRATN